MFREEDLTLKEVREQLRWSEIREHRKQLEEAERDKMCEKQAEDYYNDMLVMFDYFNDIND